MHAALLSATLIRSARCVRAPGKLCCLLAAKGYNYVRKTQLEAMRESWKKAVWFHREGPIKAKSRN